MTVDTGGSSIIDVGNFMCFTQFWLQSTVDVIQIYIFFGENITIIYFSNERCYSEFYLLAMAPNGILKNIMVFLPAQN